MSIQNLTEQLEAAIQQFKANSPIEAQIRIGQMIEELQKSGIASGKQPGEKAVDFKLKSSRKDRLCWCSIAADGVLFAICN